MKKLTIPCDFDGFKIPTPIYIGEPDPANHPVRFQSLWLRRERGGSVPPPVMDSFGKLQTIAKDNNASFEELCVYALGQSQAGGQEPPGGGTDPA